MAGLHIPITATDNNVSSKLDQVARKIDELASKAQASNNIMIDSNSKLGASFNALATKVGASVAAIASVQKLNEIRQSITQVRGEFEQLEISLSTILGSKAEADKLMAQVVDFAAKTPFDMKGVASGVKQLLAYGSSEDSVIDEMRMLGDIASGLSIPLGDMVYLFGTTRTQGRMFTQDLRQFMGRGIPLAEELANQFGVTKAEVGDLVTAGKVGFNEMYKALQAMTSEGGKFYNLMDSQSRSILGMQSNAEDARDQMYNEIGKLLQGVTAKGIEAQNYLYENYEKIGRTLLELVGIYGTYKAVLITLTALQKAHNAVFEEAAAIQVANAKAGKVMSDAQAYAAARTSILNKGMKGLLTTLKQTSKAMLSNPYVLAAAAVAGLAYGIYKLVTAKSAEERANEAVNKSMKEYDEALQENVSAAQSLASASRDENKSAIERRQALDKLISIYPELLDKYGEEKLALMDILTLNKEIANIGFQRTKDSIDEELKILKEYSELVDGATSFDKKSWAYNILRDKYGADKIDELEKKYDLTRWYDSDVIWHGVPEVITNLSEKRKKIDEQEKKGNADKLRQEEQKATQNALDEQKKAEEKVNDMLFKSKNDKDKAEIQQKIDLVNLSAKNEKEKQEELHQLRLEMIQLEQAIALETLDLEYKKYKAIFEAAGKDTKPLDDAFAKLRQNTVDSFKLKSDKEDADYAKKKKDREEQVLDDMIAYNEKYGNVMEQRTAIVQKYARLIAKAENEAQKKTLEKEREKELRDFDNTQSGIYYEMFVNTEKATMLQIERAIELVKQKMEELLKDGINPASEEMQNLREQYEKLIDSQSQLYYKGFGEGSLASIFKSILEWRNAKEKLENAKEYGSIADIKQAQMIADQSQNEFIKELSIGSAKSFANLLQKSAVYMKEIAVASGDVRLEKMAENVSDFGNALESVLQGFAQGGIFGAVASLILAFIDKTVGAITSYIATIKRLKKNIEDLDSTFKELDFELGSDKFDHIFGSTDYLSKITEAVEKYNQALKEFYALRTSGASDIKWVEINGRRLEGDELQEYLDKYNDALQRIQVETGEKNPSSLGMLSTSQGWGIWDENGFNAERARIFLDSTDADSISDEDRRLLEDAIAAKEALEELEKVFDEFASQIFGDISTGLTDAIVNAVHTGSNAFEDFGKVAAGVIENIGRMWLESMIYQEILKDYEKEITDALKAGDASRLTELTGEMLDEIEEKLPGFIEWYQNLVDGAKERGIDMDMLSEQEATAKGFKAMSQETGDELNGRFTDIQAKSGMIAIGVNSLVQINTSIFQNTSAMLLRLGEMFGIQNLQLKELNTISKNTGYLQTIYEEISTLRRNVGIINGD